MEPHFIKKTVTTALIIFFVLPNLNSALDILTLMRNRIVQSKYFYIHENGTDLTYHLKIKKPYVSCISHISANIRDKDSTMITNIKPIISQDRRNAYITIGANNGWEIKYHDVITVSINQSLNLKYIIGDSISEDRWIAQTQNNIFQSQESKSKPEPEPPVTLNLPDYIGNNPFINTTSPLNNNEGYPNAGHAELLKTQISQLQSKINDEKNRLREYKEYNLSIPLQVSSMNLIRTYENEMNRLVSELNMLQN